MSNVIGGGRETGQVGMVVRIQGAEGVWLPQLE